MNLSARNVTVGVTLLSILGAWFLVRHAGTGRQAASAAAHRTMQSATTDEALGRLTRDVAALQREYAQLTRSLRTVEEMLTRSVPAHDVAALQREYAQLTRSLRTVEETLTHSLPVSPPPGTPSAAERGAETEAGDSQQRVEEAHIMETLSALDLQLDKEPDDGRWGPDTEMDIATFVDGEAMEGSQVLHADCRSTLCRVELEHADVRAQEWLVTHIPREPPFDGEILIHHLNTDSLPPRTLIYLARPGHPLRSAIP